MSDFLKGKTALVTGSGQGIGRAIAIRLGLEGANVVTNNRKPGSTGNAAITEETLSTLSQENQEYVKAGLEDENGDAATTAQAIVKAGGNAIPFFGDVADFDIAGEAVEAARKEFGSIDIVVNVAGNFSFTKIWEMDVETWKRGTETVKPGGHFNVIRHAVPYMMEQKWGRIINATSRAWLGDFLAHAEYCTANAAVVGLTRGIAKELMPYGITCNSFAPFAKTRADYELRALEADSDNSPWISQKFQIANKKSPLPENLAPFIAYLASEDASYVSGSVFNLAGNTIGLYSEPEVKSSITKYGDDLWTMEELASSVKMSLFKEYKSPAILD